MSSLPTSASTWAPGAVVPGTVYRIIRPLGQGGMGEVYEVEHDLLGTRRALKVLARHYASREDLAERLRVEARGLARLKHPNLVEVYDLGTSSDGRIFFAMELLKGATLRELLRHQGKLTPAAAVRVAAQVLDGLDVAHAAGMLHRDVKPENVFVCRDGMAKLLDFGVAKAIDASTPAQSITGVGMTVGTPRYMSPEQAEGRPVDATTDVYSVGLVLWELLMGRPPFEETDPMALAVTKVEHGVPPLETAGVQGIPWALCEVVNTACRADPRLRFSSAEAFAAALRASLPTGLHGAIGPSAAGMRSDVENATTVFAPVGGFPATRASSPSVRLAAPDNTEIDPSTLGVGATVSMGAQDDGLSELTERIASVQSIDRDQPTCATPNSPPMLGPRGTAMLPAVAASRRVSLSPTPVTDRPPPMRQPGTPDSATVVSQVASKRRTTNWMGIAAGVAAFVVPVSIALVVGLARFDVETATPPVPSAAPSPSVQAISPGQVMEAVSPEAGPPEEPSAAASPSAAPVAASASSASPPTAAVPVKTGHPPAAATSQPPATSARPRTMPASGL